MSSLKQYVCWNEPLYTAGPAVGCIAFAEPDEVVTLWRITHPDQEFTWIQALEEFMVTHWAWFVYLPEDSLMPWERTLDNIEKSDKVET